jgi:Zn-dependent protease
MMVVLVGLALLWPGSMGLGRASDALTFGLVLFGIVLLHEFGHCFASRWVGGSPHEILIWPLGGLAFADAPPRPWATFITVLGGPLVNVLICLVTGAVLVMLGRGDMLPLNLFDVGHHAFWRYSGSVYYAGWIFTISWALLLFNVWPVYPLDGAQLVQSLLWVKIGYYRSMYFASVTGLVGAVVMAMVGLAFRELLLLCIAISGFLYCLQLYRQFRASSAYEYGDMDYGTTFGAATAAAGESRTTHRKLSRRWINRQQRIARREQAEQAKIDTILAKVSAHGMHSLNWREKRRLRQATERQRQRDLEMSSRSRGM